MRAAIIMRLDGDQPVADHQGPGHFVVEIVPLIGDVGVRALEQLDRLPSPVAALLPSSDLALGNPPTEILKTAETLQCDLIAMTSHGHRFLADIVLGSTIEAVRHRARIPLLIVRAE